MGSRCGSEEDDMLLLVIGRIVRMDCLLRNNCDKKINLKTKKKQKREKKPCKELLVHEMPLVSLLLIKIM